MNSKHIQKQTINKKCTLIYRSLIFPETLKPWGTIVIRHPLDIVPKQGNSIDEHTVQPVIFTKQENATIHLTLDEEQCYLWFEMYMMGTPGIFLTLLFRSLSTVARM